MKLKNNQIYTYAQAITDAFTDKDQYLPIRISFFIQKNKATLVSLAQDIEDARIKIIKNYGKANEETGTYTIPEENVAKANEEINNLFEIEQEVNIYFINFNDLPEDVSITTAQMEALMFMIQ